MVLSSALQGVAFTFNGELACQRRQCAAALPILATTRVASLAELVGNPYAAMHIALQLPDDESLFR